ncbi:hypothetical protein Kfla_0759 [Kribbella flavida DSM 17836]|uniref:Uncharacterized protein n=1 Tax=Kribbella flavida (strain DSM 17836 / JCM 10339 / NBRC 14399) TaxID=479435 RepID=D2PYN2_KRIFD|nr:hypothetical protein [Kribbella flavida]ADB29878.1 hypothetical protein Kfla_0759 [Kribbella flavida DSM 17836]
MTAGDIHVEQLDGFDFAGRDLENITSVFSTAMTAAGNNSASPAAGGMMQEGEEFMRQERQARDLLAQYMTKVKNGLGGYGTAVEALGQEHDKLTQLTTRQMQTLLRPQEGPVPLDPAFDWRRALTAQSSEGAERGGQ